MSEPAPVPTTSRGPIRLALRSPDGRRVLARPNGVAGWALPTIAAPRPFFQWSADDVARASAAFGTPVVPVRRLAADAWEIEALDRIPAAGNDWVAIDGVHRLGVDAAPAQAALVDPPPPAEHLQPGWWTALGSWAASRFEVTGTPRLLCHWELSAVVAVPTTGGDVVVKQNGPGFTREAAVLEALADVAHVPAVLGAEAARVATGWAGTEGADAVRVAGTLGRLHREASPRVDALRQAGCPEATDLARSIGHPAVARHLAAVERLGLAPTAVHADAHPGNVLVDGDSLTVIDWTDTVVGPGALDLPMLLLDAGADRVAVVEAWAKGYGCDPGQLHDALASLRVVAHATVVALYEVHDDDLPDSARPWWSDWTDDWRARLDRAAAEADAQT